MMNEERMQDICKMVQRITLILGALSILIPILFWGRIPDTIPSHYNAVGVADRYSDKGVLILLFVVNAFLMGMMSIAIYFVRQEASSRYTKEAARSQMADAYGMLIFMNFVIQCMFSYIIFCSAASRALGGLFLPIVLIAVFAPIVFFFIRRYKADDKTSADKTGLADIEKQEQGMIYRSKVDWWLGLLLYGGAVRMVYLALEPIIRGEGVQMITLFTAVFVLIIVLPLFWIRYVFYSDHLLVSCGIYGKERIEYASICRVKETKNPLSSAAMSLDRIQIDYLERGAHKTVLISPVRKREFMDRLEQYREERKC